jgi:hypothetical protein
MNHDEVLNNRAQLSGAPATETDAQSCGHHLLFALRDKHHEFSLDVVTVLQCLQFAEDQGAIPVLPEDWWIAIRGRYHPALGS